jgi:RNA polymerase sigma-70 factor, ECF subfamily
MSTWFAGRETVTRFLSSLLSQIGQFRMVPVSANGQRAFAAYQYETVGPCRAHAVVVPTPTGNQIARTVIFLDRAVFGLFNLPDGRSD